MCYDSITSKAESLILNPFISLFERVVRHIDPLNPALPTRTGNQQRMSCHGTDKAHPAQDKDILDNTRNHCSDHKAIVVCCVIAKCIKIVPPSWIEQGHSQQIACIEDHTFNHTLQLSTINRKVNMCSERRGLQVWLRKSERLSHTLQVPSLAEDSARHHHSQT